MTELPEPSSEHPIKEIDVENLPDLEVTGIEISLEPEDDQ